MLDTPALNLDVRFSDDNFTIGSTLLRNYQRNGFNIIPSKGSDPSIIEKSKPKPQQQKIQRPSSLQTYSDDYENITSTRSSTPIKQKLIPEKPRVIQQPLSSKFFSKNNSEEEYSKKFFLIMLERQYSDFI